jgi:hypothetical protein
VTLIVQVRCIHGENLYCPTFLCDSCGAPIDRYDEGIAEYTMQGHSLGDVSGAVQHFHVGKCAGKQPARAFSSSLREHLIYLCNNSGFPLPSSIPIRL